MLLLEILRTYAGVSRRFWWGLQLFYDFETCDLVLRNDESYVDAVRFRCDDRPAHSDDFGVGADDGIVNDAIWSDWHLSC